MALPAYALPFGLRQVVIFPLDAAGARIAAASIQLPASRTFSFSEVEDFETLDGDDRRFAAAGTGPTVEWDLEGGGISLLLWKALSGGTITSSGTTPAIKQTFTKLVTDARPYFDVEGRAISDNGGDFHMVVYRCKADGDLEAEMANGSFLLTSASGTGYGNLTGNKLYDFVHNETAEPVTTA